MNIFNKNTRIDAKGRRRTDSHLAGSNRKLRNITLSPAHPLTPSPSLPCSHASTQSRVWDIRGNNRRLHNLSPSLALPRTSAVQYILFVGLIILSSISYAQNSDQLCELRGGLFNIDFALSTNILHELGAPLSTSGQIVACSYPTPLIESSNPAGWAFLKKRTIAISFTPGITADISKFIDIQSEIESTINQSIADYRGTDSEIIYPNLIPTAGIANNINHARFALPGGGRLRRWTFAFQFAQSGLIDFSTRGNDLAVLIETLKQVGDEKKLIRMRMNSNLGVRLTTSFFNLNFDTAYRFSRTLAMGVSLRRYLLAVNAKGELLVDGIIQTAGAEYVFNDPYDKRINFDAGEQNTLDQRFNAGFQGSAWGISLGANWFPANWAQLGLLIDVKPEVVLTGEMDVRFNQIPALNLESMGDVEAELVDPTRLNLAKLTLTEKTFNKTTDRIQINLPSVIHIGARLGKAKTNVGLNYAFYLGPTFCGAFGREYGLHQRHGIGFDTTLGFFRLGLGIILASNYSRELDSSLTRSKIFVIPMTTLNFDFSSRYGIHLGNSIILSPLPTIGLTAAFTF